MPEMIDIDFNNAIMYRKAIHDYWESKPDGCTCYEHVATGVRTDKGPFRCKVCYPTKDKIVDTTYKGWTFITIAPSKLKTGGLKMKDEELLEQFCHRWFAKYNFSEYFWVIEYGKDAENPFLHVHALFKGIVNKKFKKEGQYKFLREEWNKLLPCKITNIKSWMEKKANPQIDADVLHQRINDKSLWELKYNYLHNDLKGTHQNFSGGTQGVISSN